MAKKEHACNFNTLTVFVTTSHASFLPVTPVDTLLNSTPFVATTSYSKISYSLSVSLDKCCIAEIESPYMELVWACIMQITNLRYAAAHLEYSEFINIKHHVRTHVL